nr:DUF222 domain-containing protein [Rhodococcus sp. SGAir0479]
MKRLVEPYRHPLDTIDSNTSSKYARRMNPGGLNNSSTAAAALLDDDAAPLAQITLLQTTVEIRHEIERLEALCVKAVARIDEQAISFDTLGFRSVKQWLAANTLLEVPAAARILALGRALSREPGIAEAHENRQISSEHAALISKFCERPPHGMPAEALPDCRRLLLDCAAHPAATTMSVRTCISRLERIFESDELPPSEDADRNEFHASKTLNGRVAVKGDLDAVTGEMLLTALSALTKPRNPSDDPAASRTAGQRRADAFAEILRRYLDSGDAPIEGGERPHLSLHVNAETSPAPTTTTTTTSSGRPEMRTTTRRTCSTAADYTERTLPACRTSGR